jgi:tetratricopeptide (TPR) repeat protein
MYSLRRFALLLPVLALAAVPGRAQTGPVPGPVLADSVQRLATSAFFRADQEGARAARMLAERALVLYPNEPLLHHHLGYALYREALLMTAAKAPDRRTNQEKQALRDLLARAQQALERSAALRPIPETYAILSAVAGQQAGAARGVGAMRHGMRAGAEMERAVELGAGNPRVWLTRGTNALYTPAMWGGGQDKAQQYLQKAVDLFRTDSARGPLPTWGRAEAYAWLGMVLLRKREYAQARTAYNEALRIEPGYGWVRNVLLPRLDREARAAGTGR